MKVLENHHMLITVFVVVVVVGVAAFGVYMARTSPTGIAAIVGSTVSALTGIHAGTSAVAANPGTMAYGSPALPPAAPVQPTPPPPAGNLKGPIQQ